MTSRQALIQSYKTLLQAWPRDPLRPPQIQFSRVITKRISVLEAASSTETPVAAATDVADYKALEGLMGDAYKIAYKLKGNMMRPASNVDHYTNLVRELEVAPGRSWFEAFVARMKGVVRFK